MLSTSLAAYTWLAPAIIATELIVGLLLACVLVARPRISWTLAAIAVAAPLALTLYPSGRASDVGCTFDVELQLLAPEPLANIALFVPMALLVAIATGSPLRGALAGAALSAAIEVVQAVAPIIGRACTADDWLANSIGAALGAGVAALALLLRSRAARRRGSRPSDRSPVASTTTRP
ncbi:VanZ family protein [Agrococcus terreus]|uniref:VanZ family protein n=1 Tax=Agrococcus terreus TaxID=574649 RepID=UPI00384FF85F